MATEVYNLWNLILQALIWLAMIATFLVYHRQLKAMREGATGQSTLALVSFLQREEVRAARRIVRSELKGVPRGDGVKGGWGQVLKGGWGQGGMGSKGGWGQVLRFAPHWGWGQVGMGSGLAFCAVIIVAIPDTSGGQFTIPELR